MKSMQDLREKLHVELDEISRKPDMGVGDLEVIHKLTDTIKNIDKICAMQEHGGGGYSSDGEWRADGRYARDGGDGYSREHWVRGHYSRDGRRMDGGVSYDGDEYSGRHRDSRGRYARAGDRSEMMEHLSAAVETADEEDRETIRRFVEKMRRA